MDSLLASYASSDEDERDLPPAKHQNAPFRSSFLSSLPQPKSSSLPQPVKTLIDKIPNSEYGNSTHLPIPKPTSLFSALPQPKSESQTQSHSKSVSKPSRVVQFRPPIVAPASNLTDFGDEDEEIEKKKRRDNEYSAQPPSVMSFLSSIPAPRNSSTLGVMPSSGSGRRSIIEMDQSANSDENQLNYNHNSNDNVKQESNNPDYASGSVQFAATDSAATAGGDYGSYQTYDQDVSGGDVSNYTGYHENYNADHGQIYPNNWIDRSGPVVSDAPSVSDSAVRELGKRRRNEFPTNIDIIEVRQDDLMKNRPREDQAKSTGIAFGPSYQAVSTKGKPSKLHKRKHQISSLYFDMKSKETELAERRAKGFQTKAQTQGKYGW